MKIFAIGRAAAVLIAASVLSLGTIGPAFAQGTTIDPADTAWMMAATCLVLMMTVPGLALFYCGMVRKKNVLATMAQSVAATAIVSVLWMIAGYSLAFTGDGWFIGSFARVFLHGMGLNAVNPLAETIPESVFMLYQMTFAIITVALVAGSVADRMRFSAFVLFGALWLFVVYVPVVHWVWGGGFLDRYGVLDFAGGTVVHINAGVAGLVAALVMGSRRGYGSENLAPYDLSMAVVGTGLLWVGWFGFNGGSALGATPRAAMAIVCTHLAASTGAVVWMALEWKMRGKASVLGMISGAVAGLGTITPASGFVMPWAAVLIGAFAGGVCFWACTSLKLRYKYDDSLDVFGVHGMGGITGTLLCGVFAVASVSTDLSNPHGIAGLLEGNPMQLWIQAVGVLVTVAWCGGMTFVLLKLVQLVTPLRVSDEHERMGLDITQHGESIHT